MVILLFFKVKAIFQSNKISGYTEKLEKYQEAQKQAGKILNPIPEVDGAGKNEKEESKTQQVLDIEDSDRPCTADRVFDIEFDEIGLRLANGVTVMQGSNRKL